ncbi:hypothetical protein NDU88_001959 [Pleurodeles waltl]|uniref:Uncharacterized protein n=1 Tax=Pleurodeles waltl TaxID=8319 RepID=A0AAV7NGM5_PLEWA|nr:hypothetical protein NDU88_001959 [Pleurodeles waltl]
MQEAKRCGSEKDINDECYDSMAGYNCCCSRLSEEKVTTSCSHSSKYHMETKDAFQKEEKTGDIKKPPGRQEHPSRELQRNLALTNP